MTIDLKKFKERLIFHSENDNPETIQSIESTNTAEYYLNIWNKLHKTLYDMNDWPETIDDDFRNLLNECATILFDYKDIIDNYIEELGTSNNEEGGAELLKSSKNNETSTESENIEELAIKDDTKLENNLDTDMPQYNFDDLEDDYLGTTDPLKRMHNIDLQYIYNKRAERGIKATDESSSDYEELLDRIEKLSRKFIKPKITPKKEINKTTDNSTENEDGGDCNEKQNNQSLLNNSTPSKSLKNEITDASDEETSKNTDSDAEPVINTNIDIKTHMRFKRQLADVIMHAADNVDELDHYTAKFLVYFEKSFILGEKLSHEYILTKIKKLVGKSHPAFTKRIDDRLEKLKYRGDPISIEIDKKIILKKLWKYGATRRTKD